MLKIAIIGTWVPDRKDMKPEQAKYYKNIEVISHSVLPKSHQNRHDPNQHESLVTFALTRPIWDVEVHCIECLDHRGCGTFDWFMKALNMCRDQIMPDLIQASLGFSYLGEVEQTEMKYASRHLRSLNTVLSAAAGNEGQDPVTGGINPDSVCWPAKLSEWVACGSSEDGERSEFSSIGEEVLFVMDGHEEKGIGLNGTEVWSGTSLSSPQFAGVCARMMMEVDKLPVKVQDRQNWLLSILPFMCWNPRSELNEYEMIQHNELRGCGSLQRLYKRMCDDYDKFREDNIAGTLSVNGNLTTNP